MELTCTSFFMKDRYSNSTNQITVFVTKLYYSMELNAFCIAGNFEWFKFGINFFADT